MKKTYLYIAVFSLITVLSGCSNNKAAFKEGANLEKASGINVQLGSGYMAQGKYDLAKEKLEKAILQNPDNALAYSTMAILHERTGKTELANEFYEKSLSLNNDNSDIHNNYGTFLCEQHRYDEANNHFEIAINDPYYKTPHQALTNAGICEMRNKNYQKAEDYLRKALRKNDNASLTLLSMGELGVKAKKYLMARAYLQRFHSQSKPSEKSLWLQIQAERALGDKKEADRLGQLLNKYFPDSDEAGKWMEIKENERRSRK